MWQNYTNRFVKFKQMDMIRYNKWILRKYTNRFDKSIRMEMIKEYNRM